MLSFSTMWSSFKWAWSGDVQSHCYFILMVSCQKGPTRHAYAWRIGPFWQDTLDMCLHVGCLWTRNMGPALCRWCTSETAGLIHTNSSSLEWTWYGNLQQSCAQIMCQKSCSLYLSNFKFVGIVLVLDVHCCTPLLIGLPMYITYMRPTRWWWGYLKNCWQGVRPRFSKPYPWLWRLNAKIIALPLGNGSKATYPWQ